MKNKLAKTRIIILSTIVFTMAFFHSCMKDEFSKNQKSNEKWILREGVRNPFYRAGEIHNIGLGKLLNHPNYINMCTEEKWEFLRPIMTKCFIEDQKNYEHVNYSNIKIGLEEVLSNRAMDEFGYILNRLDENYQSNNFVTENNHYIIKNYIEDIKHIPYNTMEDLKMRHVKTINTEQKVIANYLNLLNSGEISAIEHDDVYKEYEYVLSFLSVMAHSEAFWITFGGEIPPLPHNSFAIYVGDIPTMGSRTMPAESILKLSEAMSTDAIAYSMAPLYGFYQDSSDPENTAIAFSLISSEQKSQQYGSAFYFEPNDQRRNPYEIIGITHNKVLETILSIRHWQNLSAEECWDITNNITAQNLGNYNHGDFYRALEIYNTTMQILESGELHTEYQRFVNEFNPSFQSAAISSNNHDLIKNYFDEIAHLDFNYEEGLKIEHELTSNLQNELISNFYSLINSGEISQNDVTHPNYVEYKKALSWISVKYYSQCFWYNSCNWYNDPYQCSMRVIVHDPSLRFQTAAIDEQAYRMSCFVGNDMNTSCDYSSLASTLKAKGLDVVVMY